jgi:peroxiredoxin family protein
MRSTRVDGWVYNRCMSNPLVIFLHSDSYDRIYQALNMIATAASAGRNCRLFMFYHALGAYMAGDWDQMRVSPSAGRSDDENGQAPPWEHTLQQSFELANSPSLYELLERSRKGEGEVEVFACSNSVQYLGLEPADVKRRVDAIVGLATMLEIAADDCRVLYL